MAHVRQAIEGPMILVHVIGKGLGSEEEKVVPSSPILSPQAFCNISLLIFDRFSKTMCVSCTKFNNLSNAALHDFLSLFV